MSSQVTPAAYKLYLHDEDGEPFTDFPRAYCCLFFAAVFHHVLQPWMRKSDCSSLTLTRLYCARHVSSIQTIRRLIPLQNESFKDDGDVVAASGVNKTEYIDVFAILNQSLHPLMRAQQRRRYDVYKPSTVSTSGYAMSS